MSEKSTLSLNGKLSPEMQNKLQKRVGKPSATKSEAPKFNNTNTKGSNSNNNKSQKPKLDQEELEKKHKAIELHKQQKNFLLSVTHELKSPLASIKLYLETILKRDLDPAQQSSFLKN